MLLLGKLAIVCGKNVELKSFLFLFLFFPQEISVSFNLSEPQLPFV